MNIRKVNTVEITTIGLMTAIICILAPLSIPIPFSVVPISFTNLAIYLTVFILGWKRGTISYLIYLLIGLAGVPVFSRFTGGPNVLFGSTGGYLIGFIFLSLISGFFIEKFQGKIYMYVIGMVLGLTITYLLGNAWYSNLTHITFQAGLPLTVVPFIPGDIAKIVFAVIIGPVLRKNITPLLNKN